MHNYNYPHMTESVYIHNTISSLSNAAVPVQLQLGYCNECAKGFLMVQNPQNAVLHDWCLRK